jgi:hypothetical protein
MTPSPHDCDLTWEVLDVSAVILLEGAPPFWKIVSADFSAYHAHLRHVVELAQRAKTERRKLKAGYARDASGRLILHSAALTDSLCNGSAPATKESERDGFLF